MKLQRFYEYIDNKNSVDKEFEVISILELRKENNIKDNEVTLSYYDEYNMIHEYTNTVKIIDKILEGIEAGNIIVDKNYKILSGKYILAAYSELLFNKKYNYEFDGKVKILRYI